MANSQISISFTISEINSLVNLLSEREQRMHLSMLVDQFEIPLKKKLLEALTQQQGKEFIRLEVKKVLSRATGIPVSEINDDDSLTDDLHLNSRQIRALAVPFTNIARQFNPAAVITPDECEECDTVDDCVTLVFEKSK